MSDADASAAWVARVLGVDVGHAAVTGANGAALGIWQQAKDNTDHQLAKLYGTLKETGVPALNEVADEIETVLGNFRVGLVGALIDYDRATGPAREKARAAALKVVGDYQTEIPNDPHVIAADTNPFGVTVTIRETLGGALATLQRQLSQA